MHAAALHYFRVVARTGSVRKAGLELNVAASAVNRQIKKIEDELGLPVFERLQTGMRLTPAGEYLLRHVNATLHGYEKLRADIDQLRQARTGHIGIAAVDSLLVDFLPRTIDRFRADFPAVNYSVDAVSPGDIPDLVASQKFDIGLTFVSPAWPKVRTVVEIPAPIGVIMRPDHPLASRPYIEFGATAPFPKLAQAGAIPIAADIDPDFWAFRSSFEAKLTSNSIQMLKMAVLADQGIAFFTRFGFLSDIEAGTLAWRPFASRGINRLKLGLIVPAITKPSASASRLTDFLARELQRIRTP